MASIQDIWVQAHAVLRCARRIINRELKPLGISSAEGNILLHMWVREQSMTQEQLGEELDIGKAAVSRSMNALVEKGYIQRLRHPDDKRAYQLVLTEKARIAGPKIERSYNRTYELAQEGIPSADFERIVSLLSLVADNFAKEL